MSANTNFNELIDSDYYLADEAAWFTVRNFSIRIHTTDEGVVVDIYPIGREDESPIAATYAFDGETEGAA